MASTNLPGSPDLTGLTKSLHDHFGTAKIQIHGLGRLLHRDDHPATGCLGSTFRPSEFDGLPGDGAWNRVSLLHGHGVHDPRHDLSVGTDIGRGNVASLTEHCADFGDKTPSQLFQFPLGELLDVDLDRTFGAAIRNVRYRAFPCHPHRPRGGFVDIYIRVISEPAFRGPPRCVVLNSTALENLDFSIVQYDGKMDDQLPHGLGKYVMESLIEIQ